MLQNSGHPENPPKRLIARQNFAENNYPHRIRTEISLKCKSVQLPGRVKFWMTVGLSRHDSGNLQDLSPILPGAGPDWTITVESEMQYNQVLANR
jgi:hypothetical protein